MQPRKFDFSHLNSGLAPKENKFDFSHLNTSLNEENKNKLDSNIASRIPGAAWNVAKDVGNVALELPGKLIHGAMSFPSNAVKAIKGIPDVVNQIYNEPNRAARNVLSGLADIGHSELNIPRNIGEYLAKIGMIEPETAKKIPIQKDINSQLSQFVGENEKPGDVGIRKTIGNLLTIIPSTKVAQVLNPMKLTAKGMSKELLNAEKAMKEKYSGPNGLYTNLFKEAENRGIGEVKFNPSKIDLETIEKYAPEKKVESLKNFLSNPTLENAQKSISDLGVTVRELEKKTTLLEPEKDQLKAAINARNHIEENMFKDESGNLHKDLLEKHAKIQKGYATEYIPYKTEKDIQLFKRGKLSAKDLIEALTNKKYGEELRQMHPSFKRRETAKQILKSKLGQGGLFGLGTGAGYELFKELTGKND